MTLGNMRANGVRSLAVACLSHHHEAVLDVAIYSDDLPVPAFGPRMVCTVCGGMVPMLGWRERAPVCLFGAPEPRTGDGGFQGAMGQVPWMQVQTSAP